MKSDKVKASLMMIVSILLAIVCWYTAVYYEKSSISLVPILVIMFVCCPATIASTDVLTNGLFLSSFAGPRDFGCWGKYK